MGRMLVDTMPLLAGDHHQRAEACRHTCAVANASHLAAPDICDTEPALGTPPVHEQSGTESDGIRGMGARAWCGASVIEGAESR